jgi:photosystem II stability/assembly factor-like uncharacterized protein
MKKFLMLFLIIITASLFLDLINQNLYAQKINEDESHDNPFERDAWRFQMRRDENGNIPFDALVNAKNQMNKVKNKIPKPLDAGINRWEWLGPGNIGGRVRAIAINPKVPNVMYLGGVSGGIWRSDNAGDSWYPISDFIASLNVTSLVMDPNNPTILYAATGEGFFPGSSGAGPTGGPSPPGAGMFKSTDAGITWTQLRSTANPQWSYVNRLSHHPTLSNVLLAATSSGVYRTTDGGVTWSNVLFVYACQVKYNPVDPSRVLCGTNTDFYLSTDGGLKWSRQTIGTTKLPSSPGRCEGDFAQTDISIYVNVDINLGELWRSTNSGQTWELRNTGTGYFGGQSQGAYDDAIWVDPANSNFIILSGRNLQRSIDGGKNLTKIGGDTSGVMIYSVHPDIHAIIPHPQYNGTTNKTIYIGCDGGIYRTDDIASASLTSGWHYLNNNLGITQFYSGTAAFDGSLIAGGAQDNDRLHYTPSKGIEKWFGAGGSASGGDGTVMIIDYTNANRIYAEATNLSIARSDDGGKNYTTKTNGITDNGAWVSPLVIDPNDHNTLLAGGTQIWKSTDAAENWISIRNSITSSSQCSAIDIAKNYSNDIWVGYIDGTISRSINGGVSWDNINIASMPKTAVTSIAINPNSVSDVMVTFGGFASGRVWLTDNGGITWQQRSNSLPDIQVNAVKFHPLNPDWVYIGTDLGIFASEDKGITWSELPVFALNEGPVNVEVSQLFWQGNEYLIAATFGRGMFRTKIQSGIFVDVSNPNPGDGTFNNPFQRLQDGINAQLNGTPLYIKAGTYQQGQIIFNKRGHIWTLNGPVIIK